MSRYRGKRTLIILALALSACQKPALSPPPTGPRAVVHMGSTASTAALMRELAAEYQRTRPDIQFAFRLETASYHSLLSLAEPDRANPSAFTYALTPYLPPEHTIWAAPIGQDELVITVGPAAGITEIALNQLQAIYRGQITNWQQLGGSDQPITTAVREPGAAARALFDRAILRGQPLTSSARLAPGPEAMRDITAQTPGVIGYAWRSSLPTDAPTLQITDFAASSSDDTAGANLLTSTLYIVGSEEPTGIYREFFAWIQGPAGQQVVGRRHAPLP